MLTLLAAPARLHRRADFTLAVRRGRRTTGRGIVVHYHPGAGDGEAKVGFIVGRALGPAVARNRLRRQLRHLMAARLDRLPAGARVVVRATPAASGRDFTALGSILDDVLTRAFATAASR